MIMNLSRFMLSSLLIAILLASNPIAAAPYHPTDPGEVLERLPVSMTANRPALTRLRTLLTRTPASLDRALELTDSYLRLGRKDADPRFYAYAEGVIRPWTDRAQPPPGALLRRASIRQFRHDFTGALSDLTHLTAVGYDHPQVALLTASILRLQGNYLPAMRACVPLMTQPNRLPALTCALEIQSLGGDLASAEQELARAIAFERGKRIGDLASADVLAWSNQVLAGIAERAGDIAAAEQQYLRVIAEAPDGPDVYTLGAYADFLLDQGRSKDVVRLLDTHRASDSLLLRLALARARLDVRQAYPLMSALQGRFDAARARGEMPHLGEEARFELTLRRRPAIAYRLAVANWRVMHEPRDALTLAECALALGDPRTARTALAQLRGIDVNDVRLRRLKAALAKRIA